MVPANLPTETQILGRAAGENFPVTTAVLGRRLRAELVALYGWARLIDQLGDDYPGDRKAALGWAETELSAALACRATGVHVLVRRAANLVMETGADPQLLRDIIEANRIDQRVSHYGTFEDLVGYCRYSANPVGRLVLAIFGGATPQQCEWSDSICTALQLIEHCGDVAEDAAAGRIYLPADDLERFEVDPAHLSGPGPAGPPLRALICFQAARARRILGEGEPLVTSLSGRARFAVSGFVAGGYAALDALAAASFDPLGGAPRPAPARLAIHLGALYGGRLRAGLLRSERTP